MARAKGGQILIKIDKDLTDVTSADFDVKIFKEMLVNKIIKPIRIETKDYCILFPIVNCDGNNIYAHITDFYDPLDTDSYFYVGIAFDGSDIIWTYTEV